MRILLISALAAALLAGCSAQSQESMKTEADHAGQSLELAVKTGAHKAGKAASEGLNSTKIMASLMASKKLDASHIRVHTHGTTIELDGSVPSTQQQQLAERIAKDTAAPDQNVISNLSVAIPAEASPHS